MQSCDGSGRAGDQGQHVVGRDGQEFVQFRPFAFRAIFERELEPGRESQEEAGQETLRLEMSLLRLLESLVEILESLVERSLMVPDHLVERANQISDGGVVGALGQSFVGESFVHQVGDQGGGCVGAFHDLPIVVNQQTGVAGLAPFFLVVTDGLRYVLVHFVLMWGGDETRGFAS